jgi:hypothetical protein
VSKFWKVAAVVMFVSLLGVAVVGAVVMAQEPEDGAPFPFDFRAKLHEAIAGVLGIGVEEYDAAVEKARGQVLDEAVVEGWLTEEQAEGMQERADLGFGPGMHGGFYGPRGGTFGPGRGPGGMMGGPENSLMGVAAEALDMTVQELVDALEDGTSIADMAREKGVEPQTIADAFVAEHKEWLASAVEDGRMTQQQADWMLERMQEQVQEHLEELVPLGGGPGGCWGGEQGGFGPGRMGPGRMGGYPGTSDL